MPPIFRKGRVAPANQASNPPPLDWLVDSGWTHLLILPGDYTSLKNLCYQLTSVSTV